MKTRKDKFANKPNPTTTQKKSNSENVSHDIDQRPENQSVQRIQQLANEAAEGKNNPIQKKENRTGLPDKLKSGVENLSGYSMDDVKVHYNSDKPAQLQAHAFAQGTNIHLASGQEHHLPHETWHVVQQKQGRVQPTTQLKQKVNINDDQGLEKEADVMGEKALQLASINVNQGNQKPTDTNGTTIQRALIIGGQEVQPYQISGARKEAKGVKHQRVKEKFNAIISSVVKEHGSVPNKIRSELVEMAKSGDYNFKTRREACEATPTIASIKYKASKKRGLENVDYAHINSIVGLKETKNDVGGKIDGKLASPKIEEFEKKMKKARVTFNFNYQKSKIWQDPKMLNSLEVYKKFGVVTGNLQGYVATRDNLEHEQFNVPKAIVPGSRIDKMPETAIVHDGAEKDGEEEKFKKLKQTKKKATAVNNKVLPSLRPKYAALNFANYDQGAAPSKFYGKSHMVFKKSLHPRCTITGGDSLGSAGGFAGLAFPLTDTGIKGLIEYCLFMERSTGVEWASPNTDRSKLADVEERNKDIDGVGEESPHDPDWNFVEVQIHGDVNYAQEVESITIASSELGGDNRTDAIEHIKKVTKVNNVECI